MWLCITEQLLRMESKPLFGVLPARTSDCINALVKFAAVSGQICDPEVIKQHCLRLLSGQYTMIYTERLSGCWTEWML